MPSTVPAARRAVDYPRGNAAGFLASPATGDVGHVLLRKEGAPLARKEASRIVDRAARGAGLEGIKRGEEWILPPVTPHSLRHSHIAALIAHGAGARGASSSAALILGARPLGLHERRYRVDAGEVEAPDRAGEDARAHGQAWKRQPWIKPPVGRNDSGVGIHSATAGVPLAKNNRATVTHPLDDRQYRQVLRAFTLQSANFIG
jgi:hypothetical protein